MDIHLPAFMDALLPPGCAAAHTF